MNSNNMSATEKDKKTSKYRTEGIALCDDGSEKHVSTSFKTAELAGKAVVNNTTVTNDEYSMLELLLYNEPGALMVPSPEETIKQHSSSTRQSKQAKSHGDKKPSERLSYSYDDDSDEGLPSLDDDDESDDGLPLLKMRNDIPRRGRRFMVASEGNDGFGDKAKQDFLSRFNNAYHSDSSGDDTESTSDDNMPVLAGRDGMQVDSDTDDDTSHHDRQLRFVDLLRTHAEVEMAMRGEHVDDLLRAHAEMMDLVLQDMVQDTSLVGERTGAFANEDGSVDSDDSQSESQSMSLESDFDDEDNVDDEDDDESRDSSDKKEVDAPGLDDLEHNVVEATDGLFGQADSHQIVADGLKVFLILGTVLALAILVTAASLRTASSAIYQSTPCLPGEVCLKGKLLTCELPADLYEDVAGASDEPCLLTVYGKTTVQALTVLLEKLSVANACMDSATPQRRIKFGSNVSVYEPLRPMFHVDQLVQKLGLATTDVEVEVASEAFKWLEHALRQKIVSGLSMEWNVGGVWIGLSLDALQVLPLEACVAQSTD